VTEDGDEIGPRQQGHLAVGDLDIAFGPQGQPEPVELTAHLVHTQRRGEIRVKARADNAVSPGTVFVPFAFVEAAANLLTNAALDPFGKIPEFKYCAAQVEKAEPEAEAAAE